MPLPSDETTPPVTKTYLVAMATAHPPTGSVVRGPGSGTEQADRGEGSRGEQEQGQEPRSRGLWARGHGWSFRAERERRAARRGGRRRGRRRPPSSAADGEDVQRDAVGEGAELLEPLGTLEVALREGREAEAGSPAGSRRCRRGAGPGRGSGGAGTGCRRGRSTVRVPPGRVTTLTTLGLARSSGLPARARVAMATSGWSSRKPARSRRFSGGRAGSSPCTLTTTSAGDVPDGLGDAVGARAGLAGHDRPGARRRRDLGDAVVVGGHEDLVEAPGLEGAGDDVGDHGHAEDGDQGLAGKTRGGVAGRDDGDGTTTCHTVPAL